MIDDLNKLPPEQVDLIKKEFQRRYLVKYEKIQTIIMVDEHVAEASTYVEWMSACLDTVVACAMTLVLSKEIKLDEAIRLMESAEFNAHEILRVNFAQSVQSLWAQKGGK